MGWILILWINAGTFAKGDSNSIASIPGFHTKASCEKAGSASEVLVKGTAKDLHWVCVEQP